MDKVRIYTNIINERFAIHAKFLNRQKLEINKL